MAQLLTIQEIAAKLKVPISWIYKRTGTKAENTIPHLKVGKYLRFNEIEVINWLRQRSEKQRAA